MNAVKGVGTALILGIAMVSCGGGAIPGGRATTTTEVSPKLAPVQRATEVAQQVNEREAQLQSIYEGLDR